MANEITVTTGLRLANGLLIVPSSTVTTQFTQTTARGGGPGVVDIGTSEETISFGDCVPGYVQMINTDATNYVEFGGSTGVYVGRLAAAGGMALFQLNTAATLYMRANTATCKVKITSLNT